MPVRCRVFAFSDKKARLSLSLLTEEQVAERQATLGIDGTHIEGAATAMTVGLVLSELCLGNDADHDKDDGGEPAGALNGVSFHVATARWRVTHDASATGSVSHPGKRRRPGGVGIGPVARDADGGHVGPDGAASNASDERLGAAGRREGNAGVPAHAACLGVKRAGSCAHGFGHGVAICGSDSDCV
jgi:hypothetical protein